MKKTLVCLLLGGLLTGVANAKELTTPEKDAAIAGGVVGGTILGGAALYNKYKTSTTTYKTSTTTSDERLFMARIRTIVLKHEPDINILSTTDNPKLVNFQDYTIKLGEGTYGIAFLNPETNRVLKRFKIFENDLDNPQRSARIFNELQEITGNPKLATATLVQDINSGKIGVEMPYINGEEANTEMLNELYDKLLQKGIYIEDLDIWGNVKVDKETGKPIIVDGDRRVILSDDIPERAQSFFSMMKLYKYPKMYEKAVSEYKNLKANKVAIEQDAQRKANQLKSQKLVEEQENASVSEVNDNPSGNPLTEIKEIASSSNLKDVVQNNIKENGAVEGGDSDDYNKADLDDGEIFE